MLFGRRVAPSLVERVRVALWPRRSFDRSIKYLAHRIWRLKASAHSIALGVALGVFAICTPFLGLQMTLAALLALIFRASVVGALLGTFAGNPITYPLIWIATHRIGLTMTSAPTRFRAADVPRRIDELWRAAIAMSPQDAGEALRGLWRMIEPMALGALPVGGVAALATYGIIRRLLARGRAGRHRRIPMRFA